MITMFTAPKPFVDPHIITIQRNALENWKLLAPDLEVFVVGDEEGIVETAEELGIKSISSVKRNALGTPLLDDIFQKVRLRAKHDVLCYANADILFLDDLLPAVQRLKARFDSFLAVGQRWDVDIRKPLDFSGDWSSRLQESILNRGKLHPPNGQRLFHLPAIAVPGYASICPWQGRVGQLDDLCRTPCPLPGRGCNPDHHDYSPES